MVRGLNGCMDVGGRLLVGYFGSGELGAMLVVLYKMGRGWKQACVVCNLLSTPKRLSLLQGLYEYLQKVRVVSHLSGISNTPHSYYRLKLSRRACKSSSPGSGPPPPTACATLLSGTACVCSPEGVSPI